MRMGRKGDLSNFERSLIVGARQTSLSISETADLISRVYRECCEKRKNIHERRRTCLVDVSGELADWFKMIERQQ